MFKTARKLACSILILGSAAAGDQTPPAPPSPTPPAIPVAPHAPPTPPAITVHTAPHGAIDWNQYRTDFLSADAAKQQAATKFLIDAGANGYNVLGSMLNNADQAVVKRATAAREQIDMHAFQMYQDASELAAKVQKEPLTVAALESVRQAWMRLAVYAAQPTMKQSSFQNATELQKTIKTVDEATKQLDGLDTQMKAVPEPQGLTRASLQVDRAGVLMTLERPKEAQAAAQDAAKASGKEGRHTPAALKAQIDACIRLEDPKTTELLCRQILQNYPRSLQMRFAYSSLIQVLINDKRFDESIDLAKTFAAACPFDEMAQDSVYAVMDALMNSERDYKRVAPFAEWVQATLPVDRQTADVPKLIGGCNEYVLKNYAKAERAYTALRDQFSDLVNAADMNGALARLKDKADGKFPKEPAETDVGLAGVFAKFLKSARERDTKTLATLVPKADAEDFIENFNNGSDDLLPTLTFADFIVKKVEQDDKKDTGQITLDYYEAAASKPRSIVEQAVKEDGQWKIAWENPESEDDSVQLTPVTAGATGANGTPAGPASPAPVESPKK